MSELPPTSDEASLAAKRVLTGERLPESGTNWQVERQLITPEEAHAAMSEVSNLISVRRSKLSGQKLWLPKLGLGGMVSKYPWVVGSRNLHSFDCSVEPTTERDGLRNHPDIAAHVPNLLALYDKRRAATGSSAHGFLINIYGHRGLFPEHTDSYPKPSEAITLAGLRSVKITDPLTHQIHPFTLDVGDGFQVDNPAALDMRPAHQIENAGKALTVSFVV